MGVDKFGFRCRGFWKNIQLKQMVRFSTAFLSLWERGTMRSMVERA